MINISNVYGTKTLIFQNVLQYSRELVIMNKIAIKNYLSKSGI